jgi:hypothetical protein
LDDIPSHEWLGYFQNCGCGTTIDAAEKLGRDWIGIDVTQLAISLIKNRLQDTYGSRLKSESGGAHAPRVSGSTPSSNPSSEQESPPAPVPTTRASSAAREARALLEQDALPNVSLVCIIGEPTTPNATATLAEEDKYQFQWWACGLVGAPRAAEGMRTVVSSGLRTTPTPSR